MINAAFAQTDTGPSLTAVRRDLSETSRELESLRAALDTKLATLEAALASSEPCDSLETLVIDLARIATTEAEAAAVRACLEVQLVAQEQVGAVRAEAEQSVHTERANAVAVRAELEDLQVTLQVERETAEMLRRELEEHQGALEGERAASSALRQNLAEAEQRISVVESAKEVEVSGIREQLMNKLALQRAEAEELERVLEKLRCDLGAARDAADKGLADSQAAQLCLEAAERHTAQTELERQEALAGAEAALRERDALAAQLQAAREDADKQLADFRAAQSRLEAAERHTAQTDVERQEALAGAEGALRERDALAAQLQAAREDADKQLADFRAAQSRLEAAERHTAQIELERQEALEGAEGALRERDALSAQLQAARDDAGQRSADFEAARLGLEVAERQTEEAEQQWQEADTRAEAAVRERAALAGELEVAREAAGVASEILALSQAVDAERAEMARMLTETQVCLETTIRDRDAVTAESEAACHAARAAILEAEARYEDLRGSTERRIRDLELELFEGSRRGVAPTDQDVAPLGDDPSGVAASAIGHGSASSAGPGSSFNSPKRQSSRHVLSDEVQVQIDGAPAILVDLSANGAQILSPTALKPNRAVKVLLPFDRNPILCKGKIAWARLELPSAGGPPKYRGGIFFTAVDEPSVEAFLAKRGVGPSRRPTLIKTRSTADSVE